MKAEFRITQTFDAPNKDSKSIPVEKKLFKEGDLVSGVVQDNSGKTPMVVLEGKYLIPQMYTEPASSPDSAVENYEAASPVAKIGNNVKNRVANTSKAYKAGAVLGATVGLFASMYFKKKWWIWTGLGAVIGGYTGHKIAESKNEGLNHGYRILKD